MNLVIGTAGLVAISISLDMLLMIVSTTQPTLIIAFVLITLLVNQELLSGLRHPYAKQLRQTLNVAILPLLVSFVASIAIRIAQALHP